jgi:RTX calcium-binding nonapeptide repeat (4 copies)
VAVAAALLALSAAPASADHVTLDLTSTGPQAGGSDSAEAFAGSYYGPPTSADGTRVYFSTAEPLVAADTDDVRDVYSRAGGVTTLISDGQAVTDPANGVYFRGASADGTKALLITDEQLTADDGDNVDDYYVHDIATGTTMLISDGPTNSSEPVDWRGVKFTPDMSHIAFATKEPIDTSLDVDNDLDVYEWAGGAPFIVSETSATPDTGSLRDAVPRAISSDGSIVTFNAREPLTAADGDAHALDDYQRTGSTITLISDNAQNADDGNDASLYGVSSDGSHVFWTTREKAVAADLDSASDVYERVSGGPVTLVSGRVKDNVVEETDNGIEDPDSLRPFDMTRISADGTHVFWHTSESLVSEDGDNAQDIYERVGGVTRLVSDSPADENKDAVIGDVSADGSRVFFTTPEAILPADSDGVTDVYERSAGATTLLSDRVQGGPDEAQAAALTGTSSDGTRVFLTTREPLVAADGDGDRYDVYVRAGGVTTLLSDRQNDGPDGAADAFFAWTTTDGARAFFYTEEQLLAADGDDKFDVYEARAVADEQPPPGDGDTPPGDGDTPPGHGNPPPGGGGLLPGACANVKLGTARGERLIGTIAGDRISAFGGDDTVNGRAGADCLFGGRGDDKLNGGKGSDVLSGGRGNDRINARDKQRDVVNCGKGRNDRATVDENDNVKGCEIVKRR